MKMRASMPYNIQSTVMEMNSLATCSGMYGPNYLIIQESKQVKVVINVKVQFHYTSHLFRLSLVWRRQWQQQQQLQQQHLQLQSQL